MLPARSLRHEEAAKHERGYGEPEGGQACQRVVRSERDQHEKAEACEQKLRGGLNEDVGDHAGGRERTGNAVKRQHPGADEIATDLRERQQNIAPLAQEA